MVGQRFRARFLPVVSPGNSFGAEPMPRKFLLTILTCISFALASCNDRHSARQVDLNAPGAMEKLRTANPKHHDQIQEIMNGLDETRINDVPKWIRAKFEAKDVNYSPILLVTHPPLRDLSFELEGTKYRSVVAIEDKRAAIYPTRH